MPRRLDNSDRGVLITEEAARRLQRVINQTGDNARDVHAPKLRTAWDNDGGGSSVRLGRFSGAWPVGNSKSVRLETPDATEEADEKEVTAMNLFCSVGGSCPESRWCAVFEEGGQWYLLAAECGAG